MSKAVKIVEFIKRAPNLGLLPLEELQRKFLIVG